MADEAVNWLQNATVRVSVDRRSSIKNAEHKSTNRHVGCTSLLMIGLCRDSSTKRESTGFICFYDLSESSVSVSESHNFFVDQYPLCDAGVL